jgi:hypothetical protein
MGKQTELEAFHSQLTHVREYTVGKCRDLNAKASGLYSCGWAFTRSILDAATMFQFTDEALQEYI